MKSLAHIHSLFAMTALTATLSGCSGTPAIVRPGDRVEMSFTCRLPSGELAVTTRLDSDVDGEAKSPLYQPHYGSETMPVSAGRTVNVAGLEGIKAFELSVMDHLASYTVGAAVGEKRSVILMADRYSGLPKNEESVTITRIRHCPKTERMSPGEYTARTGQKAVVGQSYVVDPAIPGTVSEVSGSEVVVRFAAKVGDSVTTPFGNGVIRETEKEYSYAVEAKKGTLVRTADRVGRIVSVGDDLIGLDYGHPFGGETLLCDIAVASVEAAAQPAGNIGGVNTQSASSADSTAPAGVTAAAGDLATVNYQAMLEDGSLFLATRKEVAGDPALKKVTWYAAPKAYGPEAVTVGKTALLPGVGEAVIGMKVGDTKKLTLAPEQAFGRPDPRRIEKLPLVITLPRIVTLPADEYVKRAGAFPVMGLELSLTPFFPARVIDVRDKEVDLEFQVEDGASFQDPFGTTLVKKNDRQVVTTLTPVIGSSFPLQEGNGIITASDGTTFTVDQNHPLAGKTVVIELTLTGITKAGTLPAGELPWQEDHDAGLAAARQAGKPAMMVLHAEWCGFCKKLFSETMPDPRITSLRDRFTWIKVNSDKLTDIKKRYGQEGFPMIMLFRADGSLAQKIDGYQEAAALRAALLEVL